MYNSTSRWAHCTLARLCSHLFRHVPSSAVSVLTRACLLVACWAPRFRASFLRCLRGEVGGEARSDPHLPLKKPHLPYGVPGGVILLLRQYCRPRRPNPLRPFSSICLTVSLCPRVPSEAQRVRLGSSIRLCLKPHLSRRIISA